MKGIDLKQAMPETAAFVARLRQQHGADWVAKCVADGMHRSVPGRFYAMERGHVVGTPFPANHPMSDMQRLAIATGCTFAAFMAEPEPV